MAKYTDEQIKKALECCVKSTHFGECFENKCPMVSEDGCAVGKETLYPYVFDLINRQEAEIERLQDEIAEYPNRVLCSKGLILTKSLTEYDELINDIASEAIKKFAERLKKKTYPFPCAIGVENAVTIRAINDIVKEMVGESNVD